LERSTHRRYRLGREAAAMLGMGRMLRAQALEPGFEAVGSALCDSGGAGASSSNSARSTDSPRLALARCAKRHCAGTLD
jgi:hypothetical protein